MVCFYNMWNVTSALLHGYKIFVYACFGVGYALDAGMKSLSSITSVSPINAFEMDAHLVEHNLDNL